MPNNDPHPDPTAPGGRRRFTGPGALGSVLLGALILGLTFPGSATAAPATTGPCAAAASAYAHAVATVAYTKSVRHTKQRQLAATVHQLRKARLGHRPGKVARLKARAARQQRVVRAAKRTQAHSVVVRATAARTLQRCLAAPVGTPPVLVDPTPEPFNPTPDPVVVPEITPTRFLATSASPAIDAQLDALVQRGVLVSLGSDVYEVTGVAVDTTAQGTARTRLILRGEFAVILVRVFDLPPPTSAVATFSDVPTSDWRFASVEAVAKAGLMRGVDAGHFGPEESLSAEQMAALFTHAFTS